MQEGYSMMQPRETLRLCANDVQSSLDTLEMLAQGFLSLSTNQELEFEQRAACKVAHNRLNVAAFEIRHAYEALRDHLGKRVGYDGQNELDEADEVPLSKDEERFLATITEKIQEQGQTRSDFWLLL